MAGDSGNGQLSNAAFLAAIQNIVTSINTQAQNAINIAGSRDFYNLTGSGTFVKSGPGRIINISVIVTGSAVGTIYDAASISDTSRPIYIITFASTGIQVVNLPFQYGLLVVPGTGQTLAGSFS